MKDNIEVVNDPNVTLRCEEEEKKYFPCPICKEIKEIEFTRKGKPYLTCNDCGVQLFVRGKRGIRRFAQQYNDNETYRSYQLVVSIDALNKLREKLVEIRNQKPLFDNDEYLDIQEKCLNIQIEKIRNSINMKFYNNNLKRR